MLWFIRVLNFTWFFVYPTRYSHKVCISTVQAAGSIEIRPKFISFHLNVAFRVLMLLYQFVFVFVILVAIHFDLILLIFGPLEFSG